jgi:hypothetical protein
MLVLVIGVSVWSVVEVAKLHLDHTPRWPPGITPAGAGEITPRARTLLVKDRGPRVHQGLGDQAHLWRGLELACNDLAGALCEAADAFAEQHAKRAQQPAQLVLDPDPRAHQHLARREQRTDLIVAAALDAYLLEPAGAHDLSKAGSVVPVRLDGTHLQGSVRVTRIHTDDRHLPLGQLVPQPDRKGGLSPFRPAPGQERRAPGNRKSPQGRSAEVVHQLG